MIKNCLWLNIYTKKKPPTQNPQNNYKLDRFAKITSKIFQKNNHGWKNTDPLRLKASIIIDSQNGAPTHGHPILTMINVTLQGAGWLVGNYRENAPKIPAVGTVRRLN